jgi:hypothetical protein
LSWTWCKTTWIDRTYRSKATTRCNGYFHTTNATQKTKLDVAIWGEKRPLWTPNKASPCS